MNILFVSPCYKPYLGGTERVIEQLAREYRKMDIIDQIGLLTTNTDFNYMPPRKNLSLAAEEVIDGMRVYRLNFRPLHLKYFYSLPAGVFSWRTRKVIEDFKPDVIHYLLPEWFLVNAWVHYLTRKKIGQVFTLAFHDLPNSFRYWLMKYVNSSLCQSMDKIHVWSEYIKQAAMEDLNAPEKKIAVIPAGYTPCKQTENLKEKSPGNMITLIATGRLSEDKGQLELVKLFHRAQPGFQKQARLMLVGGDGGHKRIIEEYIRENGLKESVKITGYVPEEELYELYQKADIFVLLSRVESFGIVYAEAQSHGLPIISYGIGAVASVFKKGGILIEPFRQDQVVGAIQKLVNDDQFRQKIGREAYEYTCGNFSWSKTARELAHIYQEITPKTN